MARSRELLYLDLALEDQVGGWGLDQGYTTFEPSRSHTSPGLANLNSIVA